MTKKEKLNAAKEVLDIICQNEKLSFDGAADLLKKIRENQQAYDSVFNLAFCVVDVIEF